MILDVFCRHPAVWILIKKSEILSVLAIFSCIWLGIAAERRTDIKPSELIIFSKLINIYMRFLQTVMVHGHQENADELFWRLAAGLCSVVYLNDSLFHYV